jgi:predicted CXXCH cytochrome family protein
VPETEQALLRRTISTLRLAFPLGAALWLVLTFGSTASVHAQNPPPSVADCLSCHSNPSLQKVLLSGEPLSLFVDQQHFTNSVHGQKNITCIQCHSGFGVWPHPPFSATDRRDVTLKMNSLCSQCHPDNYQKAQDSVHASALASGNRNAAVCTDCHTAHDVTPPDQPRTRIPQTCAQCHNAIYAQYVDSVHGTALTNGNPDVPTCIDCHGVHNIGNPTTAAFRLKSPQLCAKCHSDKSIMDKYGISTDVLNTYVADFHGTTVELFAKQSPDAPTNKPVCFDCHGIHDIKKIDDPNSTVFKANLLRTCQQCHPNATTASFTGAWMSHYIASPATYPLVYYINLFYWILIPVTIGGLLFLVLIDIYRRLRSRKGTSGQPSASGESSNVEPGAATTGN